MVLPIYLPIAKSRLSDSCRCLVILVYGLLKLKLRAHKQSVPSSSNFQDFRQGMVLICLNYDHAV